MHAIVGPPPLLKSALFNKGEGPTMGGRTFWKLSHLGGYEIFC